MADNFLKSFNNLFSIIDSELVKASRANGSPISSILLIRKKLLELKLLVLRNQRSEEKEVFSTNKSLIFDFIKKSSPVRARNLFREFAFLNRRTILRILRKLADSGYIIREKSPDGNVYSLTSQTSQIGESGIMTEKPAS